MTNARIGRLVWVTISAGRLGMVGNDAAEQAQDQHRRELGGGYEAQRDRVVGELEDQPALRDALHPRADQRDQHAREEESEVAVAERPHAVGQAHPADGLALAVIAGVLRRFAERRVRAVAAAPRRRRRPAAR